MPGAAASTSPAALPRREMEVNELIYHVVNEWTHLPKLRGRSGRHRGRAAVSRAPCRQCPPRGATEKLPTAAMSEQVGVSFVASSLPTQQSERGTHPSVLADERRLLVQRARQQLHLLAGDQQERVLHGHEQPSISAVVTATCREPPTPRCLGFGTAEVDGDCSDWETAHAFKTQGTAVRLLATRALHFVPPSPRPQTMASAPISREDACSCSFFSASTLGDAAASAADGARNTAW
jgi:hypothetical protein